VSRKQDLKKLQLGKVKTGVVVSDPYRDLDSQSGSRRAKITQINRKQLINSSFEV
jgi:hypothetical protein